MTSHRVKTINIAREWSKSPTGRYEKDGKSNATSFKKKFIIDYLDQYDEFLIELDGTHGYGSSFLDEAFAGLVRSKLITKEEFFKKFKFVSVEDPSFVEEIEGYVADVLDSNGD